MKFRKLAIFTMILSVFLSGAAFTGCGENRTYAEVQALYNGIVEQYTDVFFNGDKKVDIHYSSEMQSAINDAVEKKINSQFMTDNEKQLIKLSDNADHFFAVFEPIWDATLKGVQNYIQVTVNTELVPTNRVNTMYQNLSTLKNSLNQMNIAKTSLEGYATNLDTPLGKKKFYSWLPNYYNRFFEVIGDSSNFALDFIYCYRDFVIELPEVGEGRLQPNALRLEIITKLNEFVDIYQEIFLSQSKNKIIESAPDFCAQLLASYREVESILKSESFNQMTLTATASDEETDIVQAFELLNAYNPLYLANQSNAYRAIKNFKIEDLRSQSSVRTLTLEEQSAIDKIDEFMQIDCVIVLNYLKNINEKVKDWDDIHG